MNSFRPPPISSYAYQDIPPESILRFLDSIPSRWGRMPPLCRAVIVEAGCALKNAGIVISGDELREHVMIGIVGGTRWGSHTTDLRFIDSMKESPEMASPAIFGYTLANIALAEAASQYGLTGPVYALYDQHNPLLRAQQEAKRILKNIPMVEKMLACEFDAYYRNQKVEEITVNFILVEHHD